MVPKEFDEVQAFHKGRLALWGIDGSISFTNQNTDVSDEELADLIDLVFPDSPIYREVKSNTGRSNPGIRIL